MSKIEFPDFTEQITKELEDGYKERWLLEKQEELIKALQLCGNDSELTRIEVPPVSRQRRSIGSLKIVFCRLCDELERVQKALQDLP